MVGGFGVIIPQRAECGPDGVSLSIRRAAVEDARHHLRPGYTLSKGKLNPEIRKARSPLVIEVQGNLAQFCALSPIAMAMLGLRCR